MLLLISLLLLIILLSRITEEMTQTPATLSVILYSFAISLFFPQLFSVTSAEFDEILYLMLPVILLPDILNISIKELKAYSKEIFYLAVVAVIGSIAIATLITPYVLPEYNFTIGMLVALFTMLMATDAITVSSIMNKFKLPERLKIYAESESIFNDVVALIIFYFIALPLIDGGAVSLVSINYILFKVLIFSTIIGVVVAYFGFLSIKILKNPFDQFIIIYLVAILSFLISEYFNIAGILSIVASTLTFKYLIQKETKDESQSSHKSEYSILELIKSVPAVSRREFREYKKEAMFIGIFANAIVFVIIANIIDLSLLWTYLKEILIVFFITTLIRFMSVSSLIVSMKLPFRWAKTLTLSGTKGGLAIIMVHSIPQSFIYKDLFEALVIGNVLISTFIYTFILMYHIKLNQGEYEQDMLVDIHSSDTNMVTYRKNIVEILEKDMHTQAYNRQFTEEKISSELMRSSRYKLELAFLILKLPDTIKQSSTELSFIGGVVVQSIRVNDYFGKLRDNEYVIIATNTSLGGAVILAEKISQKLLSKVKRDDSLDYHFGVTQANETDDIKDILEKLHDALHRSTQSKSSVIEIEA
ncbi:MAG: cation:proton antiporter [Campylobacterota bacterium]|nr:cation:proton antiporter [Campylobacterota bacterium]